MPDPIIPDDLAIPEAGEQREAGQAAATTAPQPPAATAPPAAAPPAAPAHQPAPPAAAPPPQAAPQQAAPLPAAPPAAAPQPAPAAAPEAAAGQTGLSYEEVFGESEGGGQEQAAPTLAVTELRRWLIAVAAAAFLGFLFAAVSTSDFIQHLDRQVHSIHCSFIPGAGQGLGDSGCRVAMMSPYSSMFRTGVWGGIPISLLGLAVFAYLIFRALEFALRRQVTRRETLYLLAATGFPLAVSVIYAIISATALGTACKLCIGIYISSAAAFLVALLAHRKAPPAGRPVSLTERDYGLWFGEGVLFVAVLTLLYVGLAPRSDKSLAGCGTLVKQSDPSQVLLDLGGAPQGVTGLAVIDPLCAACEAFDRRLEQSGLLNRVKLSGLLMPLDNRCNWMVSEAVHPGACLVSEALLCDRERAPEILAFAFANREQLIDLARQDERALKNLLVERFPSVKGCIGGATIRNKLNKSLRFAVANAMPVLTPQLFVGGRRVCDEDTDLGLEYTVANMLSAPAAGARVPR